MMKTEREAAILRAVRIAGSASVTALADTLGASEATVRRDLLRLDEEGLLRRTHGGATLTGLDAPFPEVQLVNSEAKTRIAQAAASLVQDGQTIVIDIGTTTLPLAIALADRPITVVTSSLAVFEQLQADRHVQLVLLAGTYEHAYRSLVGHLTVDSLRQLRADHTFLGASGVDHRGDVRDTTIDQVPIKRAMMDIAEQTTLLVDGSKFPGCGSAFVCSSADLDRVITDDTVSPDIADVLTSHGTEVMTA